MVKPPHVDRPVLDLRKLEGYCQNPGHPRGRHKARVFREALGIGRADAGWLRDAMMESLAACEAAAMGEDIFGSRWRIDIPVAR